MKAEDSSRLFKLRRLVYPESMRVPVLAAPTAAGKTAAALELAESLPLEVISADAMQVYKGMDLGTAKPTAEEQAALRHHLIDVVPPDTAFSVADYVRLAERAIAEVLARRKLPLVLGGTGFYLRALSQGLPTAPAADPELQAELWRELEQRGLEALLAELRAASPKDAGRAQRNPRRVVRALEVLRRSGRPPSAFPLTRPAYRYDKVVLLPELEALKPRIEARTEQMFARGLVGEVRALLAGYPSLATARQAIGYKEVADYLAGVCSLADAKAAVTLATWQYAKRQRTWFRKEPDARRLGALAHEAVPELKAWLARWKDVPE